MNRRGFTLIELMIVVAIVGLLASIAVPRFTLMQLRAKRAEVPLNLSAISTAQQAYFAEFDSFTNCAPGPSMMPSGRRKTEWSTSPGDRTDWELLGWAPDGDVWGSYLVDAQDGAGFSRDDANFTATGNADVDGDSVWSTYQARRGDSVEMLTPTNWY